MCQIKLIHYNALNNRHPQAMPLEDVKHNHADRKE